MSEEQVKAVETEATTEQEEGSGEEISEEDLAGVAGGGAFQNPFRVTTTERTVT